MLQKIRLVNFQCHIEREFDLHPHVTVFVGDNGVGKSAVIRALRWAALNEWDGEADKFIHWDATDAEVCLKFDDQWITRLKGKLGNIYVVGEEPLEAIGIKVPISVQQIVNMTEDNFQRQIDPAFWFSLTAGNVAKSLNKIVNLCSIDSTLANAASKLKAARARRQEAADRLDEARKIKKSLDWTIQADKDLQALEAKSRNLDELSSGVVSLARWEALLISLSARRKHAAGVIQSGQKVIDKMDKIGKLDKKLASLKVSLDLIEYTEGRIKWLRSQLQEKESRLRNAQAGKCPLCLK